MRASGDGTVPLPGWTSANGWTGTVPFEELPSVLNPARGYIVTANNAVSGGGPMLTQDWDLGYRAEGIERLLDERIASGEKLTADDLTEIQLDTSDANATALLPVIAELELDGDAARGADLLDGWDGRADVDSAAGGVLRRVLAQPPRRHVRHAPRAHASRGRRPVVRRRVGTPRRSRRALVDE